MRPFFAALSLATILCFSPLLSAQTFTDRADWEAEILGTIIDDDFTGLTAGGPLVLEAADFMAQIRPWGVLDSSSGTFLGISTAQLGTTGFILIADDPDFLIFSPDLAGDQLEGLCFEYQGSPVITIFNGTDVVDTIQAPGGPSASTICWLNTDLENVTRVEVTTPAAIDGISTLSTAIQGVSFAFVNSSPPPVDTCRSLLEDLILDLGSIESTGNNYDDQLINCALWYLNCATYDSLWSDDDRLASCDFFYFTNKATKYLSWVSDNAEVTQVLEDIQAVLSCIVENEIAAATDAGGDANSLAWARYYQDCADYSQSIGNFRQASRLRKYAFASAFQCY